MFSDFQNLFSPNYFSGVGGQPKFLGKLGLMIEVYQKNPPIGGSFGAVLDSLHLLRSARWPRP